MKQVVLNIPDKDYSYFIELFKRIPSLKVEDIDLPDWHKELVKKRIKTAKLSTFIPWAEAKKKLKSKSK